MALAFKAATCWGVGRKVPVKVHATACAIYAGSIPARFKIASKIKAAALKETQKMRGMSISCAAIAVAQEILLW